MVDWEFNYEHFFTLEKVLDVEDLSAFRAKNRSKKIVFTNGFFDLLHPGHVFLLYEARLLGDILVVGVNSDISVQKEDIVAISKNKVSRVINNIEHRVIMLSTMFFVDFITVFDEANPEEVIRELMPDVLVKGLDWEGKDIAGAEFVRSRGGEVKFVDSHYATTTTKMIEKIKSTL